MPLGPPGEGREATLTSRAPTPRSLIGPRVGARGDERTSVDDVVEQREREKCFI